jgi:hypothetical protein
MLLAMTCDSKEKSLFAYCISLSKTGIWTFHDYYKKPVRPQQFDFTIPGSAYMTVDIHITYTSAGLALAALAKSRPILVLSNPIISYLILSDIFKDHPILIPADISISPILSEKEDRMG